MLSRLSRWILNVLGWTVLAELPDVKKYVVVAAPHTSNWDFPLGILVGKALNLQPHWMGKHTLFRWPYGWFFRAIGGTPIHRDSGKDYITQMADLFEKSDRLVLALAPEGTRSKTDHWKTGFHRISRAANVPIVLAYLDWGHKQAGLGDIFYPSEDIKADFERIREYYKNRIGKNPEKASLVQVRN
jgi:1-acyl-sn-glycerol-3-phosphate acyltransferase